MELPHNIKIKAILAQGGAFKAKLAHNADQYARYYFVLNIAPQSDSVIILISSTTTFYDHQFCEQADLVHVPLTPSDYPAFRENCLVCCSWFIKIPKSKLETELQSQKYDLLDPLPQDVLTKILQGIRRSPTVPTNIKEMIVEKLDLDNKDF